MDEDRLREYFGRFGEVTEAVSMRDRTTGRTRGFGFVVFADALVAERVTMDKHMIDGRMVISLLHSFPFFFVWLLI
jgi:RNA-binding protein Musashi